MTEGYAEQFVGRRREQQRLLAALRDGSLQTVIITGLGGSGKSALATRLAWKLKGDGFTPIAVPSSREKPLTGDLLLRTLSDAFLAADLKEAFHTLSDPQIPADARLRYAVGILNKNRFLLVLDNFESNMDEAKMSIIDPKLAEFYEYLLASLTGTSRAIVTSRYLPAGKLPPKVKEEPLGDFGEASFFKFMGRDDQVESRLRSGELSHELLREVYRLFGGTPRFLDQIRKVLREISAEELKKQLEAVKVPTGLEKGELQKKLDEYCEGIFTSRLYGYLSPESRVALSRAAVYGVAVNLEGLAAVTGEPVESLRGFVREWQNHAFAYPDAERAAGELWAVYGLLRSWLLSQLSSEDRKAAHKSAGYFLTKLDKQEREEEMDLDWVDCLLEARSQYLQARDYEQTRKVTDRISVFFMRIGLYDGVKKLNEELLRYEKHPSSMNWIGSSFLERSDYSNAEVWCQRSIDIAGDAMPKEAAFSWHQLASIDLYRGEYEKARQKLETALTMRQQSNDSAGVATTLIQLATINLNLGEYEEARQTLGTALMISQQIENRTIEAAIWHQLGSIDLNLGEYEKACQEFKTSLKIRQQISDLSGVAANWHQLASIDFLRGEGDEASQKFKTALKIRQQIGERSGEAETLHNLASIDLSRGGYNEAYQKFMAALTIMQQIGNPRGEAMTFAQLGIMSSKLDRSEEGLRLTALSAIILRSVGHADLKQVAPLVNNLASELQYTQEQFDFMAREVAESYRRDRGWSLIDAAFADPAPEPDKV